MLKIGIVSVSDFFDLPVGGEVFWLRNLLKEPVIDEVEYSLIGISFEKCKIGQWQKKTIGEITYNWLPIDTVLKNTANTIIPFRLRVALGLIIFSNKIRERNFDLIYIHAPELALFVKNLKIPIYMHVHGDPTQTLEISRFKIFRHKVFTKLYNIILIETINQAHCLIWAANTSKELFIMKYPILKDTVNNKSTVIYSSFDKELLPGKVNFDFDLSKIYLITVGRLSKVKNIDFIIKLTAKLRALNKNIELIVCGNGEEEEELKKLSYDLEINNYVHFVGSVNRSELATFLNNSYAFIFASNNEALSLVVLESLYMGVPVVTTAVGDLNEVIINDKTGYLVSDLDSEMFVKYILKILERGKYYYSAQCQEMANSFSPEKLSSTLANYFISMSKK